MKIEVCDAKNPLTRDGKSQGQRFLRQLHPRYARIDERSLFDLVNYAANYAEQLQYFDSQNNLDGNWRDFFDRDVAAVISLVANTDNSQYKKLFNEIKTYFEEVDAIEDIEESGAFEVLFNLIFQLSSEFNSWILKTITDEAFRQHLHRLVSSQLKVILNKAIPAYKYARSEFGWFNSSNIEARKFYFDFDRSLVFSQGYSSLWRDEPDAELYSLADWIGDDSVPADGKVFNFESDSDLAKVRKAGDTLLAWLGGFLQAQTQLINAAPGYLYQVIHHWPTHKSHMALYLAFCRLFKYAQIHINSLTGKHLEHYYKDILGFRPLESSVDRVHLLFELAKQSRQHLLEKGTLFKAGFDGDGNPVQYKLNRELALNKAVIKEAGDIKSIYIDRSEGQGYRVFSATVANSKDGKGKEFDDSEPKWRPFGESQMVDGLLKEQEQRTAELAELGFAISSPLLDLREGVRKITLKISTEHVPDESMEAEQIKVRFSGEKDWIDVTEPTFTYEENHILLEVELDSTQPSLVAFDSEVLVGRNFDTQYPVMEVILRHDLDNGRAYAYKNLKDVLITSIALNIEVIGLKNIVVQSDLGTLDVNKPIQPFGPQPVQGSTFYIGSDEAFHKPVTSLDIEYEWLGAPDDFSEHYEAYNNELGTSFADDSFVASLSTLNNNTWTEKLSAEIFNVPNSDGSAQLISFPLDPDGDGSKPLYFQSQPLHPDITQYNNSVTQGFIKWQLSDPIDAFGHRLYPQVYSNRVIKLTNEVPSPDSDLPNEPYTPVINTISLNYTAEATYQPLEDQGESFGALYHIYPFGTLKVLAQNSENPSLLPTFHTVVDELAEENNGELYIGLSDVDPPQMVNLFFQVAEGSADPELDKETIHWSVLQNNQWVTLNSKQISFNSTNEFNSSGIVSITIPETGRGETTLLPASRTWLRASVLKNTAAVSQLIEVSTQAGEASFDNAGNDESFLAKSLPANTIGKLLVQQSQVKSVSQPYASLDGKAPESENLFNIRVSERLRHKDRAISIWDYERLVLQAFPSIYKVKCINHSTYLYERGEDDFFSSEFAPGHVTVIVIPDITNKNAINPLEPRASLDTLDSIKSFLQERMTPFAARKLRVINPFYESIQLEFTVSFFPQFDPSLYLETLNQDIMEFLSPWAFFRDETKDINFGGKVHRSVLANFVEERGYVDYITDFKMHVLPSSSTSTAGGSEEPGQYDIEQAMPRSARSIFVSHAQHIITAGDTC